MFNFFRISVILCLIIVSMISLGHINVANVLDQDVVLNFKRVTAIVAPKFPDQKASQSSVNVEALGQNPKKPLSRTARAAQLSYIGFSNPMTVQEWIDYVSNIQNKTAITTAFSGGVNGGSVQKVYNDPLVGGVAKAVTIGLLMAILSPIMMICFCACRCCCNLCGGKQVPQEGYTPKQVKLSLAAFAVLSILNLTFASLLVSFYQDVGTTIDVFQGAANAFIADSADFVNTTIVAAQDTPDLLVDTVFEVIDTVGDRNGSLVMEIEGTIGLLVNNVSIQAGNVQDVLDSTVTLLNDTNNIINLIESQSNALPATFNNLADKIDALQYVTFNGTQYPVPNFPSTASLRNITLPDFDQLPDLQDFMDQVTSLPNLRDQTGQFVDLYNDYVNDISAQVVPLVNDSIYSFRDSANTQLSGASTISAQFDAQVVPVQQQVNSYASTAKTYQSTYGLYFVLAQAAILIITIILSGMGAIMKRPPFMLTFPCAVFLLISLIWFEFVLFYLFALPFTVACNSKDAVMNQEYQSSQFTNGSIPFLGNVSLSINPQTFINSCRSGKTVFDASLNKAGLQPVDLLVSAINENLITVDNIVDQYNLSQLVNQFDPSAIVDQIDTDSLTSVNLTAFDFPPLTVSSEINSTLYTINSTLLTLTPVQFDPDLGNNSTMNSKLDAFNTYAHSFNASWQNYTYWYLSINRVDTQQWQWDPQEVTGTALPQEYADLAQDYYDAFWRVVYIRQATLAIDTIKANVTTIVSEIKYIQTSQLDVIQEEYAQVKATVAVMQGVVDQLIELLNGIKAMVPLLKTAINSLVAFFPGYLKDLARVAIQAVLNNVLVRDPSAKFGACSALASDLQYAIDGTCTTLTDTLSGLWFTCMMLGIFMILGFCANIVAKKRVLFLQRGNAVDDLFSSKENSFDKLDSKRSKERENIQASAPFEEYDVQNGLQQNVEHEELPLVRQSQDDLFKDDSAPAYEQPTESQENFYENNE